MRRIQEAESRYQLCGGGIDVDFGLSRVFVRRPKQPVVVTAKTAVATAESAVATTVSAAPIFRGLRGYGTPNAD